MDFEIVSPVFRRSSTSEDGDFEFRYSDLYKMRSMKCAISGD